MPGRSPSIYTTDQSDPRTSSTARVFITPIPIGTNGARETYVNAYIPSNDREKKNDSDVIAFCYNVNHDTPETVTNTPQPIPKTGDTATPLLWIGMLLSGLAGLIILVAKKPKVRKQKK